MKIKLNLDKAGERLSAKSNKAQLGHVLLVDDEPENLDGLEALLTSEGYRVSATTSPEEALEIARQGDVDLIISDQRMPIMMGTELLSAIKEHTDDNIRVILTGHTDMNDLIECINKGLLYRYLVKPWRQETLIEVVKEGMKKIRIERTVKRLLPDQVWDRLYAGRMEETNPGDAQAIYCAVMYIDIRGFTAISLQLTPSQVFFFLTQVMSALSPLIRKHHGYIDKYLGDGALVIFDRQECYARDALQCASLFNETIRRLTQDQTIAPMLGDSPLKVGVGIHTGEVLLGTVGSLERIEFTMIGETVHLAAQIESLSKGQESDEPCIVLASKEVFDCADWDQSRFIGEFTLSRVGEPHQIYQLT